MSNNTHYSVNFLIIGLFAVVLTLVLLLFNRFHPTKHVRPRHVVFRSIGHQGDNGTTALLQHHLGKQLFCSNRPPYTKPCVPLMCGVF